jgi:hypothetical protein
MAHSEDVDQVRLLFYDGGEMSILIASRIVMSVVAIRDGSAIVVPHRVYRSSGTK